ncbi:MAG: hypothetical protein J5850_00260 [Clostridia bacterium]|nr:hypothetical protein [Clostridia bacterium]
MKKNTAEKYYRYSLIIFIVLAAVFGVIFGGFALVSYMSGEDAGSFLIAAVIMVFIWVPAIIYYLVQFLYYRKLVLTEVQTVKLEKTDTSYFRCIGFEVKVVLNGIETTVVTKHVFALGLVGPNLLDDYSGREAKIGYNASRDEWIVIAN